MNCLSIRADIDVPMTPAFPAPAKLPGPAVPLTPVVAAVAHAGLVGAVVGETVGIVGTNELGPTVPTMGNTLGTGTAGAELTPRLLISKDPKGIPVRAPPPGVAGNVEFGVVDAAMLPEPEPHIPDNPEVSSIPEDPDDIGISDVTDVPGEVDIPVAPEFAALAGAAVPAAIPPPSKLAVDPNISEGEVATVWHAVPLLAVGIVIVPVAPVGNGLTPGDVISVAPRGIPVGEPAEPVATPNGEVAPIVGVGVTVPSNCPSVCAMAMLQTNSVGRTAAISENLRCILRFSDGVRLSGIGQSLIGSA